MRALPPNGRCALRDRSNSQHAIEVRPRLAPLGTGTKAASAALRTAIVLRQIRPA